MWQRHDDEVRVSGLRSKSYREFAALLADCPATAEHSPLLKSAHNSFSFYGHAPADLRGFLIGRPISVRHYYNGLRKRQARKPRVHALEQKRHLRFADRSVSLRMGRGR